MHKRAFQALKRTFMHVSGLPQPFFVRFKYFEKKPIYKVIGFFQNMLGEKMFFFVMVVEDLRHA